MAEIDPVILELRAEMGRYRAEVKQSADQTARNFARMERDTQRLEKQMLRSSTAIQGSFRALGAGLASYFSGRELVGLIDGFTRLQNSLKVAGLEGQQLEAVQGRLLDLSTRYGVSIESLADLYGNASQSGKELGASQEQILKLTEATSQALLITGTSSQQASGAILGLNQALASGTVRAEEFNQINEGGLRPLLQAAAASEKYGGSVAKLRAAVLDGKVSSQEFYQAILAGSAQLEGQAAKATLTLSGAFEALSSRLTVYIGQSAEANGVTAALAGAMQLLADNLDTIIPLLGIIGVALGVGFVANAVRAGAAAGTLGATLLSAFGGHVGLAITGVALAIGVLVTRFNEGEEAAENARRAVEEQSEALGVNTKRSLEAAAAQNSLDKKQREIINSTAALTGEVNLLSNAWARVAAAAKAAALEQAKATLAKANSNLIDVRMTSQERKAAFDSTAKRPFVERGMGGLVLPTNPKDAIAASDAAVSGKQRALEKQAQANVTAAQQELDRIKGERLSEFRAESPASNDGKPKKTRAGASGPDPLDAIFRAQQDELNAQLELVRAKSQNALEAGERGELERDALNLEAQIRDNEITEALRKKDITAEQAKAQREILDQLYGKVELADEETGISVRAMGSLYGLAIAREERLRVEQEAADLAETQFRAEQDALRNQYDLATTDADRRDIALRILDAEDAYLRSKLEAVIANNDLTEAVRKQAQIELAALNASAGDRRQLVLKANQGALDRYIEGLSDPRARAEEAVVRQLQEVNRGITDALSETLGVKNQFVKDLFSIFLEEVIFRPLAEAMREQQGGGGGSGFFSSLLNIGASLFGRASGGRVNPGMMYRINEAASPGRVEGFVPDGGGTVIPLGKMNAMAARSSAQSGGVVRVMIEEAPGFAATVRTEATGVAVEVVRASAGPISDLGAQKALSRASRPTL